MRWCVAAVLLFGATAWPATLHVVAPPAGRSAIDGKVFYDDVQKAIDAAQDNDTVRLAAGRYMIEPRAYPETLCGNCEKHVTRVQASRGLLIAGKGLHVLGRGRDSTVIVTRAGYGVVFADAHRSELAGVTITGGRRDRDGNATDAGIVVFRSAVTIHDCAIVGNTDRPEDLVVGIGGVFGREGAELIVYDNVISDNGWDGIALYRGATAVIYDNEINGGRGAGIGITWDAVAVVVRNKITNYWKGIGAFGESRAIAHNNIVSDNLGWGIIVTGSAYLDAVNNVVARNGNCGLAIWSDECSGRFVNNIVCENGWQKQWVCPPVGFWNNGSLDRFLIAFNDIYGNVGGEYADMPGQTGVNGNLSVDPKFIGDDFRLRPDSPCINAGDSTISDYDGSRSDMGIYGGPRGW